MKTKMLLAAAIAVVSLLFVDLSAAQHDHGQGGSVQGGMKMDTRHVVVEDVKVSFQVMANAEHRKMLADMKMKDDIAPESTHNITVVLTDQATQKEIAGAAVSMKVIDPKGKDQIKNLKYESMMKSYDGYFNLPDKGRHELLVLIKRGDRKTTAGVYYDLK